jgi:urea transport system permease protein
MQKSFRQAEIWGIAVGAFIILGVFPALNAFVPENSVLHVSDFTINLYGKYLCYAVLAISVDLLWGYTGLLSLGQCLFFALGGYAFGMHLMLMIGKLGQYHSDLPDFMVFLGYPKLPLHWEPFRSFWFAVAGVVLAPGLLALVFGFLAFRSRIRGVYFSILTQALTYGACLMFFRNDFTFGGNNGLTDFKFLLGYDVRSAATQRGLFIATGVLLVLTYVFCRWLTLTKFGKIQRAVRDSENRVLFSGYAAANFKLFVFVVSAIIAGLAGALYVPQVGIINPSEMAPDKSLEAVVWVAVGGRGTLIGPVIGAIVVNALKSRATRAFPDLWLLILGAMFVIVVLFLPKGIVGLPAQILSLFKRSNAHLRKSSAQSDVAPELSLKESSTPPPPAAIRTGRLK